MAWFQTFPQMTASSLTALKKAIDEGFRQFTRQYGEAIEGFFTPLQSFLIWTERLVMNTPWPVVVGIIGLIAWLASRRISITLGAVLTLLLIGYFGMWEDTMRTVSM